MKHFARDASAISKYAKKVRVYEGFLGQITSMLHDDMTEIYVTSARNPNDKIEEARMCFFCAERLVENARVLQDMALEERNAK